MAKILQNGNGDAKSYTIAGMTTTEFFTLFDIVEAARIKAGDPDNKEYNDKEARRVIDFFNMFNEAFINKIKL